jgi:hypothetical protein
MTAFIVVQFSEPLARGLSFLLEADKKQYVIGIFVPV